MPFLGKSAILAKFFFVSEGFQCTAKVIFIPKDLKLSEISILNLSKSGKMAFFGQNFQFFFCSKTVPMQSKGLIILY